ncbi:MAG: adenylosuccinate lyase, partial [Planctomycetota bacterium]
QAGGNRQELHEKIRQHCHAAAAQVKQLGKNNDLIERLKADAAFSEINFGKVLKPKNYIGRSPQQVDEFLRDIATPIRRRYRKQLNTKAELKV